MNPLNAAVLLGLIYFAAPAQGIKCYTCSGPGCQDPFTPVGTASIEVDCSPEIARRALGSLRDVLSGFASQLGISTPNVDTGDLRIVCAKVELKEENNEERVVRSCALHSDKAGFCDGAQKAAGDKFSTCSVCEGDLCNGSTVTHASLGLMTAGAVILMSFLR